MIHLDTKVKVAFDGQIANPRYLRVRRCDIDVAKPSGEGWIGKTTREYLISRSAVSGIIHVPSQEKVMMMRQFRVPVYIDTQSEHLAWIYETVAGLIGQDEDPLDTFIREVQEESGVVITPEQTTFHMSYFASPGFVNEKQFIYTAALDDVQPLDEDAGLDEECEAIIPAWLTYDEIRALVKGVKDDAGNLHKIADGKTLMGLMKIGLA